MLYLIPPEYLALLEDFHGIELSIGLLCWVFLLLLDEEDLSIGTLANDCQHFEVLLSNLACAQLGLLHDLLIRLHFLIGLHLGVCSGTRY